jgi:hypothetical protein
MWMTALHPKHQAERSSWHNFQRVAPFRATTFCDEEMRSAATKLLLIRGGVSGRINMNMQSSL